MMNPFAAMNPGFGGMPGAGMGGMGGFGGMPGAGMGGMGGMDPQMTMQMLQDPMVMQMLTQLMADPQFFDTMVASNPSLQVREWDPGVGCVNETRRGVREWDPAWCA